MSVSVNSRFIQSIFAKLEIEDIESGGEALRQCDADYEPDVRAIARRFLRPTVDLMNDDRRKGLMAALAYYSKGDSETLDAFARDYQDSGLVDADDWNQFFRWIGEELFGDDFADKIDLAQCHVYFDDKSGRFF